VNLFLVAAGAVVVAGGIACVTARRAAVVAIGAAILLGATPLLALPLPGLPVLAERAVGALLAGELLWVGLRGRTVAGASALGWPPMALLAAAAFGAGVGAQQLVPATGPPEALGVALALFTVAIVAVAGRSDGIHLGLSALVLIAATSVVRVAMSGPSSALETLLVSAVGAAAAAAVALLAPRLEADEAAGDVPTGAPPGSGVRP
jgi:hypothetical protein